MLLFTIENSKSGSIVKAASPLGGYDAGAIGTHSFFIATLKWRSVPSLIHSSNIFPLYDQAVLTAEQRNRLCGNKRLK